MSPHVVSGQIRWAVAGEIRKEPEGKAFNLPKLVDAATFSSFHLLRVKSYTITLVYSPLLLNIGMQNKATIRDA